MTKVNGSHMRGKQILSDQNILKDVNSLISCMEEKILTLENKIVVLKDSQYQCTINKLNEKSTEKESLLNLFKNSQSSKLSQNSLQQKYTHQKRLKHILKCRQIILNLIVYLDEQIQSIISLVESVTNDQKQSMAHEMALQNVINSKQFIPEYVSLYNLQICNSLAIKTKNSLGKNQKEIKQKQFKAIFQSIIGGQADDKFQFRIQTQGFTPNENNFFEFGFINSSYEDIFMRRQLKSQQFSNIQQEINSNVFKIGLTIKNLDRKFFFSSENRAKLINLSYAWEYFGLRLKQQTKQLLFYGVQILVKSKQTGNILNHTEQKTIIQKNQNIPKNTLFDFGQKQQQIVKISCPISFQKNLLKPFFRMYGFSCKITVRPKDDSNNREWSKQKQ